MIYQSRTGSVLFSLSMELTPFAKYEGLGNDFIVVDGSDESAVDVATARQLCDRRRGIGADGVLLLLPSRRSGADFRMKVINADGSVPEMCGNGLRCVALHAARDRKRLVVDTDAGLRACSIDGTDITVDMGVVRSLGSRTVDLGDVRVETWLADAGNPHAVLFPDGDTLDARQLGPRISTHPSFTLGTNVEFARVRDGGIDLTVWERGVGFTLACGTGACAAVAVASARGLLPSDAAIEVRLPGGALSLRVDGRDGAVSMRGPARFVFAGEIALRA